MAELVEGARLEIVLTVKGYEGSNPSLSAIEITGFEATWNIQTFEQKKQQIQTFVQTFE